MTLANSYLPDVFAVSLSIATVSWHLSHIHDVLAFLPHLPGLCPVHHGASQRPQVDSHDTKLSANIIYNQLNPCNELVELVDKRVFLQELTQLNNSWSYIYSNTRTTRCTTIMQYNNINKYNVIFTKIHDTITTHYTHNTMHSTQCNIQYTITLYINVHAVKWWNEAMRHNISSKQYSIHTPWSIWENTAYYSYYNSKHIMIIHKVPSPKC